MTYSTRELPDRIELLIDNRPVGYVQKYVLDGLMAHDGGAHNCKPEAGLMREIERRQHPRPLSEQPF